MLTIAILGRPNVGKSTLYNRLTGTRHALVNDQPGVTRDRREGLGNVGPLEFRIVDTAGLEHALEGSLAARMTAQSLEAAKQADVLLLVVDGRAGITAEDKQFAQVLRKQNKPVVCVVNKAEGGAASGAIAEAYRFGFGEPVGISAAHGEGLVDLYDALARHEQSLEEPSSSEEKDPDAPLHIAIVGRPNAGKSTLINMLIGEERVLAGPEAGITRDAIALDVEYRGKKLKLVDTAGMRKRANVVETLERMAVGDTLRALRYAEVVVLVLDAQMPLEKQDNTIAALVEEEGRALVIALNKWDLVTDKQARLKYIEERLQIVLSQVKGVPFIPISAQDGTNLDKLIAACERMHDLWNTRIPTGPLNRFLEGIIENHSPPLVNGRRLKIRYMTQIKTRPPTFTLSVNLKEVPEHYLRYMVNGLRTAFDLPGVPIRLQLKKGKNPYADDE